MPHDPFREERRRFQDMLRRHAEGIEAARKHFNDMIWHAEKDMKKGSRSLDALLAMARGLPPRPRPGKRRKRDGEPDAGGVPVEPNNPRNLSGGAAVVPETEQ